MTTDIPNIEGKNILIAPPSVGCQNFGTQNPEQSHCPNILTLEFPQKQPTQKSLESNLSHMGIPVNFLPPTPIHEHNAKS